MHPSTVRPLDESLIGNIASLAALAGLPADPADPKAPKTVVEDDPNGGLDEGRRRKAGGAGTEVTHKQAAGVKAKARRKYRTTKKHRAKVAARRAKTAGGKHTAAVAARFEGSHGSAAESILSALRGANQTDAPNADVIECEETIARVADLLADAFDLAEGEEATVQALESLAESAEDAAKALVEGKEDREVAEARLQRHVQAVMAALESYEEFDFVLEDEEPDPGNA